MVNFAAVHHGHGLQGFLETEKTEEPTCDVQLISKGRVAPTDGPNHLNHANSI